MKAFLGNVVWFLRLMMVVLMFVVILLPVEIAHGLVQGVDKYVHDWRDLCKAIKEG